MFSNEHTLQKFMMEKAEGQFHDRYEKALEQVRSEFGRTYTMLIGGSEITTSTTIKHTSPIDTRIVLGHMPIGGARHVRRAIAAAKEAFERWGRIDYRERGHLCRGAVDVVDEGKFEVEQRVSIAHS